MKSTTPTTNISPLPQLRRVGKQPAILVAYARDGMEAADRFAVPSSLLAGRSSSCALCIDDQQISKKHFRITRTSGKASIEDLGSTNGTFLNGQPLIRSQALEDQAVIRVGQVILVYVENGDMLMAPPKADTFDMAGVFHANAIIDDLAEASHSPRSILLSGPSGVGKELAAKALKRLFSADMESTPFILHNAGLFATEDEATSTIFGVGPRVFSGVEPRMGLIEQANGGTLFLDEICNLPSRVQQTLLRVIEDGKTKRIGENDPTDARVRFIFASNRDDPNLGVVPDLLARVRIVRIPSLSARVADIPSIFDSLLHKALKRAELEPDLLESSLAGDHYEALCLNNWTGKNVRGLIDTIDRIVAKIRAGRSPSNAVSSTFIERFKDGAVANRSDSRISSKQSKESEPQNSIYEQHKEHIIKMYDQQDGNASATERVLREQGFSFSRRWITEYLRRWGII